MAPGLPWQTDSGHRVGVSRLGSFLTVNAGFALPASVASLKAMSRPVMNNGLFPGWKHPTLPLQASDPLGTFEWVMRPAGGTVKAKFYTDGSRMDEKRQSMVRFGWAFVALDN